MREIKFRVWDVDYKLMRYPIGIDWENQHTDGTCVYYWIKNNDGSKRGIPAHRTLIEIMQYTGLKDKNGREIYAGDIIRFDEKNIAFIDCEDWLEFFVHWIGEPDCTDYVRDFYRIGRAEVIGNIYENPELL